jgi:cell volume regulation protein A
LDFSNHVILLSGLLALLSVLASTLSARIGMPLLLVFLVLGMLAGEDGPGGIPYQDFETTHLIGSLALAVILFNGGLATDLGSFRVGFWPAFWLATVGVVVTAAITGAAATWLLDMNWMTGLLLGAIIGSTDAAAVFSILHAHGLRLKQRVDATLQIESGINDPMAVFLTIALVETLAAGATDLHWGIAVTFVEQMGIGLAAGGLGGIALTGLINRVALNAGLYPLLALSGGLLIYGATATLGGSGYLAVFLAGLILGNRPLREAQNIRRFHDGMAWLSQITMFLILGLLVTPSQLPPVAVPSLLLAVALIIFSRPLAVGLCLLPFRFAWREQLFIGWVGLRGAVPIVLALFPLLAGLEQARILFDVAFFVVVLSLIIQGWTVAPAARLLGLEIPPDPGADQCLLVDLPGQPDHRLVAYTLVANSPALERPVSHLSLPKQVQVYFTPP